MDTSPIAAGVGDRAAAPEDPITSAQGIAPPAQNQLPGAHQAEFVICDQAIEPHFRDTKDLRFGMGLSATRVGEPMRRDRLLLVSAFATALLTLLGAVGESLGMDRLLKSNTSKTRTHSLFRQGCMLYELIPNMPEHRLLPLMEKFAKALSNAGQFTTLLSYMK